MVHVYANLLGTWTDLSTDSNAVIGNHHQRPDVWWNNGAEMWNPNSMTQENTLYQQPYVMVSYHDVIYRVFPSQIQVVEK
ncbi:hypothetical protein [Companilactobacillus sp. HBUAS59699]|uniref:hypothetical protein n=1 Tax=Companilactobacillus sp. HBUAS59699 TaxID=3109358 RepID=UPI002FF134B8